MVRRQSAIVSNGQGEILGEAVPEGSRQDCRDLLPLCQRLDGGAGSGAGRVPEGNGNLQGLPSLRPLRRLADPHRREPLHRLPATKARFHRLGVGTRRRTPRRRHRTDLDRRLHREGAVGNRPAAAGTATDGLQPLRHRRILAPAHRGTARHLGGLLQAVAPPGPRASGPNAHRQIQTKREQEERIAYDTPAFYPETNQRRFSPVGPVVPFQIVGIADGLRRRNRPNGGHHPGQIRHRHRSAQGHPTPCHGRGRHGRRRRLAGGSSPPRRPEPGQ